MVFNSRFAKGKICIGAYNLSFNKCISGSRASNLKLQVVIYFKGMHVP